jgi:hypothetical protein
MRVEYLAAGSSDCPLIRLYDFGAVEVTRLKDSVTALAGGAADHLAVHELPGVEAGCRLMLRVGDESHGVVEASAGCFECVLTRAGWHDVVGLIEPFCQSGPSTGFQWLVDTGRVSLLLSTDGRW